MSILILRDTVTWKVLMYTVCVCVYVVVSHHEHQHVSERENDVRCWMTVRHEMGSNSEQVQ